MKKLALLGMAMLVRHFMNFLRITMRFMYMIIMKKKYTKPNKKKSISDI